MADLHYDDHQPAAVDGVDETVVAHPEPIQAILALELLRTRWSRILAEAIYPVSETALNVIRESRELSLG